MPGVIDDVGWIDGCMDEPPGVGVRGSEMWYLFMSKWFVDFEDTES